MLRLDYYVSHLVRQSAKELLLGSNQPVCFRFADGEDRNSAQPIDHAVVVQLVQEAAPPASVDELRRDRRCSFRHVTDAGVRVDVEVLADKAQEWRVIVRPGAVGAADSAPQRAPASQALSPQALSPQPRPAQAPAAAPYSPPRRGVGDVKPIELSPAPAQRAEAPRPAEPAPQVTAPEARPHRSAIEAAGVHVNAVPGEPKLNHWLRMMIAVGASDLHCSSDVIPMVRRDGEMQPLLDRPPVADREMREILMEIIPDRNKAVFAERNDTDFAHAIEGLARFRVNYFADRKGMGCVIRQIPFKILSPEQLGLPPKVLDLCYLSKGLVLVTGPTGSGKSTTLATLIDVVNDNRHDHLITIEDPIEFVHPNKKCLVNQREVGMHTLSFKAALRAALREDPDIVLVGEMRDLETIAIAIETAETGHLVFGTLHTTSAMSTIDRIIDQFPADRQSQIRTMLSESLRGVVAQMLCKKKGGGRIAAYEVLIATPAVANLIREGKTFQLTSVMQTQKAAGMQTLNDCLLDLVRTDKVEPEEAYVKSNDKTGLKEAFAKNNIKLNVA